MNLITPYVANNCWIKPMVAKVLQRPQDHHWTVQGMGMMRTYFSDALRLNIWHSSLRLDPKPTMTHDHPWSFLSLIIAGRLINTRYLPTKTGELKWDAKRYNFMTIRPGEGLEVSLKPTGITLVAKDPEIYETGDCYEQKNDEIHETDFEGTAITLIHRDRGQRADSARTFWLANDIWRSAEPREATTEEIERVTKEALKML